MLRPLKEIKDDLKLINTRISMLAELLMTYIHNDDHAIPESLMVLDDLYNEKRTKILEEFGQAVLSMKGANDETKEA